MLCLKGVGTQLTYLPHPGVIVSLNYASFDHRFGQIILQSCWNACNSRAGVIKQILVELRVIATALNFSDTITYRDSSSLRHHKRPSFYNTSTINPVVVILASYQSE